MIYLVRHGKTLWNVQNLWQGQEDTSLIEDGVKETIITANFFKDKEIKTIYSSPLKRALETAKIISQVIDVPVTVDERLTECNIILWNGLKIYEPEKVYPVEFQTWKNNLESDVPGVESLGSVQRRMVDFLNSVWSENGNIIVVSHSLSLRMLLSSVMGLTPPNHISFALDNSSVSAITRRNDGRFVVRFLNLNPDMIRTLICQSAGGEECKNWLEIL